MANSASCSNNGSVNQQGLGANAGSQLSNTGSPLDLNGTGTGQLGRPQNYNDATNYAAQYQTRYGNTIPLPSQPLTEFQKFVAGTTGQMLPIFGASLFQNGPSTFAPVDLAPVPPDYVIGPGDLLRIRVWGQVNFSSDLRVDRTGDIYLPQVGPVHVAGLPFQALDEHIRTAVKRVYRNFDLTADIGQIRSLQVYVVGQAHRPGTYTVSSLSTLVDALFASGGPSVDGSLRHVLLKRGGNTIVDFDLYDLLVKGDKSKDAKLESGDIIFIPPAGPQVALTGSVRRPGIYELRDDTTMQQILDAAGGASTVAAEARISIERVQDHKDRAAMEVSFDTTGLGTVLRGGDVVRILSIVPMYQKTIMLRGNTANPGRFAWHEGMHLSDLIPDRDSLLTRNYWWKRTQLGLPAPEFQPVPYLSSQSQPTNPVDLRARAQSLPQRLPYCNTENGVAPGTQPQTTTGSTYSTNTNGPCIQLPQNNPAATASANQSNDSLDPSAQLNAEMNQPGSLTLGGNAPPDQTGLNSQRSPAADRRNAEALADREAGFSAPNTSSPELKPTTVKLPAPEIDWDYAVIERLDKETLKTSLIPFDLGKLVMQHDSSQDMELQPGDVISIFSQADIHVPIAEQTKFVRLEGEFVHSGVYSVKPGETLRQLAERAGGLTPNAYLYGSELTRESTRVQQQQRIDDYIQSLQLQIERGTLAQASSAVASAQDIASATAAVSTERELIAKLKQIRATGRVVLEVKPDSMGLGSLPDVPLEDGDRFIVPSVPASVNVVGSVYDQNSFLFHDGRRVADYLHMAGGPNRDADRKHVFVIRADGSVLSRQATSSVWGNTFDAVRLNPGDTLVVPEKTYGPSGLRGFLEFSQLFSQLAFGAAAISILQ